MPLRRLTAWLLRNSRPQFHYALLVLYVVFGVFVPIWMAFAILGRFGIHYTLRVDALAGIFGPLALGGLVAGHLDMLPVSERVRRRLTPTCSGGITLLTIYLLGSLGWDEGPNLRDAAIASAIGAALFMSIAGLFRRDAAKAAAQEP